MERKMRSFIPAEKEMGKKWHVVDAEGKILGRLAARVARLLTGKDKPVYTPFLDTGDHVIVVNAEKVRLTGKKLTDKMYRHHTGYPGGLRQISAGDLLEKYPERVVREAVIGMLPKTKLGRAMRKKLRVYRGPEHPHQAQKPTGLAV
jgi:large subunit ribosomal protein L13